MLVYVDILVDYRGRANKGNGRAEIALSCLANGKLVKQDPEKGPRPVEVENGSRNRLLLLAAVEGLKSITKPGQEICIRAEDPYYLTQCLEHLQEWHDQDFRSRGKPRSNEEELRLLWMHARIHRIRTEALPDEAV